jgi:hypothetical protein
MDQFVEYLKSMGPFTTPLCVAMSYALWWLDRDRGRILAELKLVLTSVTGLQERRAEDLAQAVQDYQEHAAANRASLEKLAAAISGSS